MGRAGLEFGAGAGLVPRTPRALDARATAGALAREAEGRAEEEEGGEEAREEEGSQKAGGKEKGGQEARAQEAGEAGGAQAQGEEGSREEEGCEEEAPLADPAPRRGVWRARPTRQPSHPGLVTHAVRARLTA
ncbi:MAG: hypothetical protein HY705_00400 [Gemmatimonadetes bacterium]|nr:hypothetical protein [Gemmatimonadota bacterium]